MNRRMENIRKCIKCGSSPSEDASITLHRFPKPGRTNSLRCEFWANYCFPNEPWSSPVFQGKLHSQHNMLCSKHFKKTCFVDQKLFRTAVPSEEPDEAANPIRESLEPINVFVPVAGPSRMSEYKCSMSIIEYCSVIWSPCYNVHQLRIERVQKRFLRHLAFSYKLPMPSYADKLEHLNMDSLVVRRKLHDLKFLL